MGLGASFVCSTQPLLPPLQGSALAVTRIPGLAATLLHPGLRYFAPSGLPNFSPLRGCRWFRPFRAALIRGCNGVNLVHDERGASKHLPPYRAWGFIARDPGLEATLLHPGLSAHALSGLHTFNAFFGSTLCLVVEKDCRCCIKF